MKKHLLLVAIVLLSIEGNAQSDTMLLSSSNINSKVLTPGTHTYLVYFRKGKDSTRIALSIWNRTISFEQYDGKEVIAIRQLWESNDTVVHKAYSISDRESLQLYYQESWWKGRGTTLMDMNRKVLTLQGKQLSDADTSRNLKNAWDAFKQAILQYSLNWHLDLETFGTLPFKKGRTFGINFYDAGFSAPALQYYTVTGSAVLKGYND